MMSSFSRDKLRFQNVFRPHGKKNPGFFKFVRFEERFRKALLLWRISLDGKPNPRNRASFSYSPAQCHYWNLSERGLPSVTWFIKPRAPNVTKIVVF